MTVATVLIVGQSGPRQFSRRQRRDHALLVNDRVQFDTLKEEIDIARLYRGDLTIAQQELLGLRPRAVQMELW